MSPEISIIILTVLAGAGQGLFTFIVSADMIGYIKDTPLAGNVLLAGSVLAVALAGAGALASFFHLTHPERGIKAIRQWRSSWLSREALFLPMFMGLAVLYAAAVYMNVPPKIRIATGLLGVGASFALFLASGMIYAAVRFIKEWSTSYTPINFTLAGLTCGGAAAVGIMELMNAPTNVTLSILRLSVAVALVAMAVKLKYYQRIKTLYAPFTIQSAIGVNHPQIKLMDFGASYDHYNTIEYDHKGYLNQRETLRLISVFLLFAFPILLMLADYRPLMSGATPWSSVVAAVSAIAGAFLERWLFFAEGNHAQNLYYGAFKDKNAKNPLLQSSKTDAPLPPK